MVVSFPFCQRLVWDDYVTQFWPIKYRAILPWNILRKICLHDKKEMYKQWFPTPGLFDLLCDEYLMSGVTPVSCDHETTREAKFYKVKEVEYRI